MRIFDPRVDVRGIDPVLTPHSVSSSASVAPAPIQPRGTDSGASGASCDALRVAGDLQAHGFQLLRKRRFHIPLLMNKYVPLAADTFATACQEGNKRLAVASPTFAPVAVRGLADLSALDAFYLGGAACAGPATSLVAALGSMYRGGYCFTDGKRNVGPYGALVSLGQGETVEANRYGERPSTVNNELDAARIEFFRVGDASVNALPHRAEARTLKSIEDKQKTSFWISDGPSLSEDDAYAKGNTAEATWGALFARDAADNAWVGIDGTPLVSFTKDELTNTAAAEKRVSEATAEYKQIMNLGLSPYAKRVKLTAWKELSVPVDRESFPERIQWLEQLLKTCNGDAREALHAFAFLRKSRKANESFQNILKDWCDIRLPLSHDLGAKASATYLRLRDHLDEALPGSEPADQKRALFLRLLGEVRDPEGAEEVWQAIDSGGPKDEEVDVFSALHLLEHGRTRSALYVYSNLVAAREPGEKLSGVSKEFVNIRKYAPDNDPSPAIDAFEMSRHNLAKTVPEPWTDAQRRAMFGHLLAAVKDCKVACKVWPALGAAGPPTEFEQRLNGWILIFRAENGNAQAALEDMDKIAPLRQPKESVEALVRSFLDVRHLFGEKAANTAIDAFRFVRAGLESTLRGTWTEQAKKDMYLKLLGALHDHPSSLRTWKYLADRVTPAADFPQLLDTFVTLLAHEPEPEARATLDLLLNKQRKGETLDDTLQAYEDVRHRIRESDPDEARQAFSFIREDLSANRPGPWTDAQRQATFMRLLDACHSNDSACDAWMALVGGNDEDRVAADFPQRLDAFLALLAVESEDEESARVAFQAIEGIRHERPTDKLETLVKEYEQIRPLTTHAMDGRTLLRRVHCDLQAPDRGPYLKLQEKTRSVQVTDEAWQWLKDRCQLPTAEAADVLATSITWTHNLEYSLAEVWAVAEHMRPGESVSHAGARLEAVRQALPTDETLRTGNIFSFMCENAEPAQETLFLQLIHKAQETDFACSTWRDLKKAGSDKTFELRTNLLIAQQPEKWTDIVSRMRSLTRSIPSGVDVDRATRAMLFVAALPDGRDLSHVVDSFDSTPGTDRTATLEWLCEVMAAARRIEGFDQVWGDVHRAGAPGTPAERQDFVHQMIGITRNSPGAFEAMLAFLRRLDRMDQKGFSSAAASAVALAGALQGHADDAERGFEYIVDAREKGAYSSETLDDTLARFAQFYAATRSVETSLARLNQSSSPGSGGIERGADGDIVIGGIHVPREHQPSDTQQQGSCQASSVHQSTIREMYQWCHDKLKSVIAPQRGTRLDVLR